MWRDARLIAARLAANVMVEVVNRPCGATPDSSRGTTCVACFGQSRRGFPVS